jgi:PAS domain S-box-containing protein
MTKARILIVEDEPVLAKTLSRSLNNLGYEAVGTTISGEDGIRMAEQSRPDLVLMDINLAGEMDGIEAAERIRNRFDIPVIYLTGFAEKDVLERAKLTEPYGYLGKPVTMLELRSTIEMALYKHEADKGVRESEAKYRGLVELSPDGVFVQCEGRIVFMNKAGAAFLGATIEEVLGKPAMDFIHPDYRKIVEERIRRLLVRREPVPLIDEKWLRLDGTIFEVEVEAVPVTYEGKQASQVVFRDLSDRKRAEESLRKAHDELEQRVEKRTGELTRANKALERSERELSAIYDSAPLMMMLIDEERRVRKANRAAVEGTDTHLDAMIGLRGGEVLKCVHVVDDPRGCGFGLDCESCTVRKMVLDTLSTGEAHYRVEGPIQIDRGDGPVEVNVLVSTFPMEVLGMRNVLVSVEDITDIKKTEKDLRKSEERLRVFADVGSSEGIIVHDGGTILDVNRTIEKMYGYDRSELVGTDTLKTIAAEYRELVSRHIREKYEEPYDAVAVRKDGRTIPIEVSAKAVSIQGRVVRVAAVRDLTERRQAEKRLQEAHDELKVTVRQLSALNEMAREMGSSLSVDRVVSAAREHIFSIIAPDVVTIYSLEGGYLLALQDNPDVPNFPEKHQVGECLCGLCASEGNAVHSVDIHSDVRCTLTECKAAGLRSFAAVPLLSEGKLTGVLGIGSRAERDFSAEMVFLETIAGQITIALDNARLYEQVQKSVDDLEQRVEERTREISEANERLKKEITQRRRAEEQIKASLIEKSALLKEIHHRDKNNLAFVCSLLTLQSWHATDEIHRKMFDDLGGTDPVHGYGPAEALSGGEPDEFRCPRIRRRAGGSPGRAPPVQEIRSNSRGI